MGNGRPPLEPAHPATSDAGLRELVLAERPGLLETALLLTGDPVRAEDVVQEALTAGHRRRPATGDRPAALLREVVHAARRRRGGLRAGEQLVGSAPAELPPDEAALADALDELPWPVRAAVVLRVHEQRPADWTSAVLGRPTEDVQRDVRDGAARLVAAAGISPESALADRLAWLAQRPIRWELDADEAVEDVLRRARSRRRRTAVLAVALAAAVAGAGFVVAVREDPRPSAVPADPTATDRARPPQAPVLTTPTRGSLAGDEEFLEALRREAWEPVPAGDRPDVVYAEDTVSGRVALLVGTVDGELRGVWLTGPVGAAPADLEPYLTRRVARSQPLALSVDGGGSASVVVVAGRDDSVEVSPRLTVDASGAATRTYRPVATAQGIAILPVAGPSEVAATSVRVVRDEQVVYRSPIETPAPPAAADGSVEPPAPLRPVDTRADRRLLAAALTELAVPLGLPADDLTPQVIWSGTLPRTSGLGRVAVLAARAPGGGILLTAHGQVGDLSIPCGVAAVPAATLVRGVVVARACDASAGSEEAFDRSWLVVTAPPEAVRAELLDERGRVLDESALDRGSGIGRTPGGAVTVRVRDGNGRAVGEAEILRTPVEPFGDYGPGPVR